MDASAATNAGAGRPLAAVESLSRFRSREETTAYIGMVVFLASWGMLFASLFFSYGLVRAHATDWPPLDQPRLPLLLPGINTAVALGASLALDRSVRALRGGRRWQGALGLAMATLLGTCFLALQAVVWTSLWSAGLHVDGGPYPSAFYALTGLHAAHVLVGLLALAVLTLRVLGGGLARGRVTAVRLWAMYWHFVGIVWLLLYVTVYVL